MPDALAALRRWRTVLGVVTAAGLAANVWAYERLADQRVGVLPAFVTTLLVAALAAWLAWTQQEIRQHRPDG